MPKLDQLEQLDVALKTVARDAEPKTPSYQIAEDFYESHRKLIEPLISQWVIEKLAGIIGRHRAKARRASNRLLVFQSKLGFPHIPRILEIRPGETIPTGDATRKPFRKLKAQIRRAKLRSIEAALEEIDRGDALFARYTKKKETEHITWSQIVEKEAEKAIQQGLFDAPDLE